MFYYFFKKKPKFKLICFCLKNVKQNKNTLISNYLKQFTHVCLLNFSYKKKLSHNKQIFYF